MQLLTLLVSTAAVVFPVLASSQETKSIQIGGTAISVSRNGESWSARFPAGIPGAMAGDQTTLSRYQAVLMGGVERAAGCSVSESTIEPDGRTLQAKVDCRPGAKQPAHLAKAIIFSPDNLEKLVACNDYEHVTRYEWFDPASDEWLGQFLSRERPLLNGRPGTPQFRLVQTPTVIGLKAAGIASNLGMNPAGVLLFEESFEAVENALRARAVDLQCERTDSTSRLCARKADIAIPPDLLRGQENATLSLMLVESRQIQNNGVLLACFAKWPGRMR